jgi:hypothetical protein
MSIFMTVITLFVCDVVRSKKEVTLFSRSKLIMSSISERRVEVTLNVDTTSMTNPVVAPAHLVTG